MSQFAQSITAAIHQQRLFTELETIYQQCQSSISVEDAALREAALTARKNIAADCINAVAELGQSWQSVGVEYRFDEALLRKHTPQYQLARVDVNTKDIQQAVEVALQAGYLAPIALDQAGWRAMTRVAGSILLTHTDASTMRLHLHWSAAKQNLAQRAIARLRPRTADAMLATWPAAWWPLAFVIRPFRMFARRLGWQPSAALGEWLGTPTSLLPALFDLVDLNNQDVLLDMGCGDGRVLIEAARQFGCRGIGVEQDKHLCELARTAVREQNLEHLVRIEFGDAQSFSCAEATVAFIFIPMQQVPTLLHRLLREMPANCRILAHEQTPFTGNPKPSQTIPLIGERALTVAQVWR